LYEKQKKKMRVRLEGKQSKQRKEKKRKFMKKQKFITKKGKERLENKIILGKL